MGNFLHSTNAGVNLSEIRMVNGVITADITDAAADRTVWIARHLHLANGFVWIPVSPVFASFFDSFPDPVNRLVDIVHCHVLLYASGSKLPGHISSCEYCVRQPFGWLL